MRNYNLDYKFCCFYFSVSMSSLTVCNPMNYSTPGFSVLHFLPEQTQKIHLGQWCNPTILSSVASFSSCPKSFPASGPFPMNWLFASGGQSIGASASTSGLPMSIQGWFPVGLTHLISSCPRDFQKSSPAPQFKSIDFSGLRLLYGPMLTSVHDYWKNHSFDYMDFCWQCDISAFKYAV